MPSGRSRAPSDRYMPWAWKWRKHQALGEKHHSAGEKNLNHPTYESSSRIRKPGLRKPKQKNPSYESSSRIRKPGLRKPKQKNPSHESSSRIRKARWINKDMAGALESQTNTFWVCWQGRRCNEWKRRGFYTALVACAPISQFFFCKIALK